jgi:prevent-host-death family protein
MVMKRAGISDLKAKLSAYLRQVRKGETVLVVDRTIPVAKLIPIEPAQEDVVILGPSGPTPALKKLKPVRLRKRVDLVELLRESRDQR